MVWADFFRALQAVRWETWALILAGAGLGIVAFVGGRLVFAGSTPPPPAEPPPQPEGPERDPFVEGSVGEKRQAARRKGGVVEVLLSDEAAQAEPLRTYVIDRSLGGLCLGGARQAALGTILTLRPVVAPPGTPWLEVKVCSCRKSHDGWTLGVQFVRVPPTSLRLLFG